MLPALEGPPVFSTDSFVVTPWRFPGGDIGKLAVCGTVNDLCMAGGEPKYLSFSLILEEGFPLDDLRAIVASAAAAAREAGVQIVTGDTKVVERGRGDGVYINTAGVGGGHGMEHPVSGMYDVVHGKGLAHKLISPVLAYADKNGVQIALETHNAANLDMYRHYGFELFDSFSGELPLREYCLVRKPKGDKEE